MFHAGAAFQGLHDALLGINIDFTQLDPSAWPADQVAHARAVWAGRVQTEYRSVQVMTRFLQEVLGAGDPLEVFAGVAAAITDEIRHTALCVQVVEALGGVPPLPDPVVEAETPGFLRLSMPERALGTALSMLVVSETISTAYIEDLRARCHHPVLRAVLDLTLDDEETHHAFGWDYVAASLMRFDRAGLDYARLVVDVTLSPHEERARAVLADMPPERRHLAAWPEPELVALGISSAERQALVFEQVNQRVLLPRLRALNLR